MNWLEIVKEMREGKKATKPNWYESYIYWNEEECAFYNNNGLESTLPSNIYSIEADDWEVLKEESDWNLAKYVRARTKYDFERHYTTEDVKKCRDLIIKELDEDLANDSGVQQSQRRIWHNWFKKIVNERFGDL